MKKNIDCINFDDLDLSEWSEEVKEIKQQVEAVKKNKRFMRKLNKIKLPQQNVYGVAYNEATSNIEKFAKTKKKIIVEKTKYNSNYGSGSNNYYTPSLYS